MSLKEVHKSVSTENNASQSTGTHTLSTRINSLQGWRVLMMIDIVVFHIFGITIIGGNGTAMPFFFMLSGFVLTYSNNKQAHEIRLVDEKGFLLKRIRKIFPTYFFALLLSFSSSVLNSIVKHDMSIALSQIKYYLLDLFLLQDWIPKEEYYFGGLGPAWFLSALFFCYLLFYPCLKLIREKNKKTKFIILLALYALICSYYLLARKALHIDEYWTYNFPVYRCMEFIMGMLVADIFRNVRQSNLQHTDDTRKRKVYSGVEFFIVIFLFAEPLLLKFTAINEYISGFDYCINLLLVCLLIWIFAQEKGVVSKFLGKKVFLVLSSISLEIYLLHTVVNGYVFVAFKYLNLNTEISKYLAIILTFILALAVKKVYLVLTQKLSKKG